MNGVTGLTGSAVGTAESTVGGAAGTAEHLAANTAGRTFTSLSLSKVHILTYPSDLKARQLGTVYPVTEATGSSLNGVTGLTGSAVGTAESTVGGAAGTTENLVANSASGTLTRSSTELEEAHADLNSSS